jgi:hypothetical protein
MWLEAVMGLVSLIYKDVNSFTGKVLTRAVSRLQLPDMLLLARATPATSHNRPSALDGRMGFQKT